MAALASEPRWRTHVRLAAFLLVLGFEALGPFYRQILHGRNPVFRNWVMFRGVGFGIVDARFRRRLPDGREVAIDRFATLGYGEPRAAPAAVWRMEGEDGTRAVAADLCRALGPGTDLRVDARIASGTGWLPILVDAGNLCAAAAARAPAAAEPAIAGDPPRAAGSPRAPGALP